MCFSSGLQEFVFKSWLFVCVCVCGAGLLREELLVSAEDEEDYEAPEEGSVLYKLYSLLDVLLMVRSTVSIAHPRHDQETFRVSGEIPGS